VLNIFARIMQSVLNSSESPTLYSCNLRHCEKGILYRIGFNRFSDAQGPRSVEACRRMVVREEELLSNGFHLAYFIIPHRSLAIQILSDARSKLCVQRSRERKRTYWRDKYLKRKITRMAREDSDLLQWLIYFESEKYERQQEGTNPPPAEDMAVRYVKHLVEITTSMSSFYVNIGLYRILHDYSTAEVRRGYEWVSEHFAGDEEYRAVKGALINRLQERFEKFLRTCRTERGEVRFEAFEQQANWQGLVEECLTIFTPWSTRLSCWVPTDFEPHAWTASKLLQKILRSRDLDQMEMQRCHAFIDPGCYGRLAKGMALDAPRDRLSLPKFFLKYEESAPGNTGKSGSFGSRRPNPPELTEQERAMIETRLQVEAVERKRHSPQVLYIVAGGRECARWDLAREDRQRLQIQDGTKLIEIWTESQGERVLLAAHLVRYTQSQGIAESNHVVDLDRGRELLLHTIPAEGGAVVELKCNPVWRLSAWKETLKSLHMQPAAIAKYALGSACLVFIGWGLGTVWYYNDLAQQRAATERVSKELAAERTSRAALEHRLESGQGIKSAASFLLVSDAASVRGQQAAQKAMISIASDTSLVTFKLPVSQGHRLPYSAVLTPFLQQKEILKESSLEVTTKTHNLQVSFPVPTSLLDSGKRYVITLYQIDKTGKQQRIDLFSFYVVKK